MGSAQREHVNEAFARLIKLPCFYHAIEQDSSIARSNRRPNEFLVGRDGDPQQAHLISNSETNAMSDTGYTCSDIQRHSGYTSPLPALDNATDTSDIIRQLHCL